MKKLLASLIAVVMVFALFAGTITVSAGDAPSMKGKSVDTWQFITTGDAYEDAGLFMQKGVYSSFYAFGWVGFNYDVNRIGFKLNGGEAVFPDGTSITPGEPGVVAAGGDKAVRFKIWGSLAGAYEDGKINTLELVVELSDDDASVVSFHSAGFYLTDASNVDGNTQLCNIPAGGTVGWWTGPLATGTTGYVDFTFTTPNSFAGLTMLMFAQLATYDVSVLSEAGIALDTVRHYQASDNAAEQILFNRIFSPGTYTLRFKFISGNYFVVGNGAPDPNMPVTVTMNGVAFNNNGTYAAPYSPYIILFGAPHADPIAPAKVTNAGYDSLSYNDKVVYESTSEVKTYKWVADPANRDAIDVVWDDAETITIKGWAQLDRTVLKFGYRIDGGKPVFSDKFLDKDRAEELELAGYNGAEGFIVTVPTADLAAGEHTIEILASDADEGLISEIIKTKDGTDYPVGLTFTLKQGSPTLRTPSVDWYIRNGVNVCMTGHADDIVKASHQVYCITDDSNLTFALDANLETQTGIVNTPNTIAFRGWATFNHQDENPTAFGYQIDDEEAVYSDDFFVDRNAELASAGFPHGEGFFIAFDYSKLALGEHTVRFLTVGRDDTEAVMFEYDFTVAEIGTYLYDNTKPIVIAGDNAGTTYGFWTGYNTSHSEDHDLTYGDIAATFTTTEAFDGVYLTYWSANAPGAKMNVNIYDEDDNLLETVVHSFVFNADDAVKFARVYPAGTYTVQFELSEEFGLQASHLVIGGATPNDAEVEVSGQCNVDGNGNTPAIALLKPLDSKLLDAAFDELSYDDTALVSSGAYKWVANKDNQDALNFEQGDVKNISFKGWAQLNNAIAKIGYVLDGGKLVTDDAFIDATRKAELEEAGHMKAEGYELTVPVKDLAVGKHTIKLVAVDDLGNEFDIVKVKDGTTYPVAIEFTISERTSGPDTGDDDESTPDSGDDSTPVGGDDSTPVSGDDTTTEEDETEDPIEDKEVVARDIDGDGEANNKDVVYLFRFVSAGKAYDATYDMDGDGEVNNKDVVYLFRALSKLDTKPVETQATEDTGKK